MQSAMQQSYRSRASHQKVHYTTNSSTFANSLTLGGMSLGYAVVQLDVTIVNTALDSIGDSLGGGVSELQWVVTAYTISFAALILMAGAIGDRLGAKKIFMAGFVIFTAASLACALAPTAAILIAARAVQGVGAAILVPNSLALLNHAYPDERERSRAVGIWAAGASLALTAGPLAGGGLIALVGWRSIFLVNVPIGVAGLWLTWRWADETAPSPHRELDLVGQGAAIGALGCLAAAIIEGGVSGWGNPWVLAGFVAAAILAALFLLQERRAAQPMLPLSLFKHRLFSLMSLVGLLVNVPFYGLIFVLSLYFQQIDGLSPFATGLAFLPMMGAVLLGKPTCGSRGPAIWRARGNRRRDIDCRGGLHRPDRHWPWHEFLGDVCPACCNGCRAWAVGSAAHLDASRECREDAFGRRGRRSQLRKTNRQCSGGSPVWVTYRPSERIVSGRHGRRCLSLRCFW